MRGTQNSAGWFGVCLQGQPHTSLLLAVAATSAGKFTSVELAKPQCKFASPQDANVLIAPFAAGV